LECVGAWRTHPWSRGSLATVDLIDDVVQSALCGWRQLSAKFISFGFETLEVDGHDEAVVDAAIRQLWKTGTGKPKALIARTVKGKGVPFMESDTRWHYTRLTEQTFADAIGALGPGGVNP
jgi:transketolase